MDISFLLIALLKALVVTRKHDLKTKPRVDPPAPHLKIAVLFIHNFLFCNHLTL